MSVFQCNLIETKEVHIKVEAENKKEAAIKAFKICQEQGKEFIDNAWYGPEESEFDEEVEVTKSLSGPNIYWDEPEMIYVSY